MSDTEKFDFGQLLEDYCSVAIKKTDFDRLKKELERLRHDNVILKKALEDMTFAYTNKGADCPHSFEKESEVVNE